MSILFCIGSFAFAFSSPLSLSFNKFVYWILGASNCCGDDYHYLSISFILNLSLSQICNISYGNVFSFMNNIGFHLDPDNTSFFYSSLSISSFSYLSLLSLSCFNFVLVFPAFSLQLLLSENHPLNLTKLILRLIYCIK